MENGESEKMRKTSPKHATPGTWNLEPGTLYLELARSFNRCKYSKKLEI
jgi:hypothetical protein